MTISQQLSIGLLMACMLGNIPTTWAWQVADGQIRDAQGTPIQLRGVNWPGFEEGSPQNRYLAPQGLWARSFSDMLDQMQALGINAVRLPFCPQALTATATGWIHPELNPMLSGRTALQVLDAVVMQLDQRGMYILLDHHRPDCIAISPLWYTDDYSEQAWIDDLVLVAQRYRHLPHLLGIDLTNEPYGATWGSGNLATDWNLAAERAAAAVLAVAPDLLIFVAGIAESTYCSSTTGHFWGENLEPLACRPLAIPADRLVLSPHVYGPDVAQQAYFSAPDFPANLPAIWEQHFGRFTEQGYTLVVGEFGGRYAPGSADRLWQDAFVDYLIDKGLNSSFYWAWNPNSSDTGGLLQDDWISLRDDKVALLQRLWHSTPPRLPDVSPDSTPDSLDWCLDIDANGLAEANRDGLLLLRWLFGLRDAPLTEGALDPAGRRTSADAIAAYLGHAAGPIEIDANGQADALTDGLLALRWLTGMRNDALIADALGTGAKRTDADAIDALLATRAAADCSAARFALAYGPYRQNQAPAGSPPSRAELNQDLALIAAHTDLIRTYGACAPELAQIPSLAAAHGIRLWQGVNLGSMNVADANDREIGCLVQLAAEHDNLAAAIVGGELLLRGDLSEQQIIDYLGQARAAGLPVATSDTWFEWCNAVNGICRRRPALAAAVDFIVAHAHPYWEGLPISQAAAAVIAEAIALRALYPDKILVIGETGWPSNGSAFANAIPSLANQQRFIEELWRLSRRHQVPVMLFEAFDEPWKSAVEGDVGAHWGLYNVNRGQKHGAIDWTLPGPPAAPTGPMISIEHPRPGQPLETKPDCGIPLFGRAYPSGPGWSVAVEVFTDQWYPQPLWYASGKAPTIDGLWAMPSITLAGSGRWNNHRIRVRLLNERGEPVASQQIQGLVRGNDCAP